MKTVIDWSARPEPWRWIGPQFLAECKKIAAGEMPSPPSDGLNSRSNPIRKHRPAKASDPVYQAAKAQRAADIASAKASLQIQHDIRAAGVQPLGASYVRGEPI